MSRCYALLRCYFAAMLSDAAEHDAAIIDAGCFRHMMPLMLPPIAAITPAIIFATLIR